jgi:hypothetical protein
VGVDLRAERWAMSRVVGEATAREKVCIVLRPVVAAVLLGFGIVIGHAIGHLQRATVPCTSWS